jgi:putative ABC transport system ATP-binding protein
MMTETVRREAGAMVLAEALTKSVPNGESTLTILQDIGLEIMPREAVAILGASGSGKSTLLGLLAGLDTPTSGSVALGGTDLFSLDEDGRAALRKRLVGFVFQSFQLLPPLTALENVMLPLELGKVRDAEQRARAMLGRVGLGERLRHYPKHLSGGEQQRVALARAFVVEPKLLFADEPTGNLDAATGAAVIDLLFELNAERGTTLVLVTHDEALARRCSRQIRLAGGRVVAPPSPSQGEGRDGGSARDRETVPSRDRSTPTPALPLAGGGGSTVH